MDTRDGHRHPALNAALCYGAAIGIVALVFLLDQRFDPFIDRGSLFLLLSMAVIAAAWVGGTGPALVATVTGALLAAYGERVPGDRGLDALLALFVLQGLLLTAILAELSRARRRAEEHARIANRALREVEGASRLKDEFLATVSHELRTPLNAVLGWVHLLRTGKLDALTASRGLASIERNARLQSQLTGNLLDISRALTGQLQIEPTRVPLVEIARQATNAALAAAQAKGVTIDGVFPEEPVTVLGDWARLRQVAWQLLANALKFTPRGGTVTLRLGSNGADAILEVSDTGPGIDPAFLPRIFDRFTQQDSSSTRTAGGLGVGLSLVRELVELHGGEISAANGSNGRGAVFTVKLPLQSADGEAVSRPLTERITVNGSPPLDGVRVLVLDRDPDARELVETVLQQRGAVVRTTESVAEALESLESWRPDVLVSDVGSAQRDSYSVIGKVPSLESNRGGRIPALALTNLARTDQQVKGLLAAALCDLPKPVEPALLTAEVARLTGRERRRAAR
jgi:signal transduction histidine kinase/CheY-like chemotaxis protein